jgi:soluble lytic murein transglycosylase-like protein
MKDFTMFRYKFKYKNQTPRFMRYLLGMMSGLLVLAVVVFTLCAGLNLSYSSDFQITSYAAPSAGYDGFFYENPLRAANNQSIMPAHSPWAGSLEQRQKLAWPMVRRLSEREDLDPALVMALVQVESRFNPTIVSHKGAVGLMQINPPTARHLGLQNPTDPEANLRAGIKYLGSLSRRFDNDIRLILAAYNAGPNRVQAAGGIIPPIKETQEFVEKVLGQREIFRNRFQ